MVVGKEIALEAKKKVICPQWFSEMAKQSSLKPLCDMFFRGSDWAMENDFPSLDILRKFIGNSDQYGLHTDFKGVESLSANVAQYVAFFGNSEVELICEKWSVCEIYIRHNSKVKIKAEENSIISVNLLDTANVEILAEENAFVKVYQYGNRSNFTVSSNVEIIEKQWQK